MDDRHRILLHRCFSELEKDLEPKKILSESASVLDATDVRQVYERDTRVDRVHKLLDLLPRRGPKAFDVFVKALEKIQPHLTITLQNAEKVMMQEELDKGRASSAMRSSERDETKAALEKEKNEHEETKRTLEEMKSQHEAMMAESAENYKKGVAFRLKLKVGRRAVILKPVNGRYFWYFLRCPCREFMSNFLTLLEPPVGKMKRKTALEKQQSKNEEKQREIKELEIKKGNLEAESKAEIKRLSGEKNSLKKENESLQGRLKNQKKKSNEKVEQLKTQQESKLEAKEKEIAELTKRLKGQESQIRKFSEEISKLKNDDECLRKALDEEKKKLKKTEEKLRAEVKAKGDAFNELTKLREGSARVFHYKNDFDKYGVIYWMASNFRTIAWEHPSNNSDLTKRVIASRSSDKEGSASDLLDHEHIKKKRSCTEAEQESWWRVELSKKYSLYLTVYTLRHGRDNGDSFLCNWQLEGSLDGSTWKVLKKHSNDSSLRNSSSYTATWSVEEETGAFRFFQIVQTGKNSSKDYGIYLTGMELYGVLLKGSYT
ncbi:serine/threonine-protein kinase MRCK beta-like [Stylophora pistillata]|uniref:serine/threonine-protein kinase MRCK beta-like n=1 Tax=Stylophora pistillata TaxID=50429 RepID=UPI000C04EEA1|nr:serine/threonine-protein kinase MRCK beta-like [Stylophora pistillata]